MTMYAVLGTGEMPAADLKASLDDLEAQAVEEQATFWMLVQATSEPTATDRALMAWLTAHECYYETVGPEANSAADIYKGTQEKHTVKGVGAKVVQLMQEKPEEGEEAILLALFASDDPDDPADAELYQQLEGVLQAGFKVLALNDGLAEINLAEGEVEGAEPEPEEAAPVDEAVDEAVDDDDAWCTRENLEKLTNDEIKVIAAKFGIEMPPRTRMPTYINAILNRDRPEQVAEAEVEPGTPFDQDEPIATTNGYNHDPSDVVKSLLRSLGEALIAASR